MTFTKREKVIIFGTIAAVCLLVADWYVLSPLTERRQDARNERVRWATQMTRNASVLKRRKHLAPKWRDMLGNGMRDDPSEAENQALRLIRDHCTAAGVRLSSLRPDRSTEKTDLAEINIHIAGTGSMSSVSRLLWRLEELEESPSPMKIKMLQLGSRKDGTDDLSVQLKVSTLYVPPKPPKSNGQLAAGGGR